MSQNGKGDKWRGGWNQTYANNYEKIFGSNVKKNKRKIFIFDVDGTLTPSRRKATKEFKEFFSEWADNNTFYLVTGSDLPKMQEQLDGLEEKAAGIFTCCGNQFYLKNQIQYDYKFTPPKLLLNYLNAFLEKSDYHHRAGNHIEDRGCMLNFSVVGRDCSVMERENYFKWDNENKEREEIVNLINGRFPELEAVIGGQISIDIYPKGMDKSQVLEHIEDIEEKYCPEKYIFIGDRTEEGGNDYPLAKLMEEKDFRQVYQTKNWESTKQTLEDL
tara:strand:- start:1410 stop:2228 length:819 start_codon:yes stop_codon:yes gene_type:complete